MNSSVLERLGSFYPEIGSELAATAPEGWRRIWVQAEVDDDQATLACFAATRDTAEPRYFRASRPLVKLFRAMREAAVDAGSAQPWTTATFVLEAAGAFDVQYGYDPVPLDDVVARRDAWEKQHLPQAG